MILITDEMIEKAARHDKDLRMELALTLYTSQVYDARKAAEIAGVSWIKVDEEISNRGIEVWDAMTPEEFENQWENFRKAYLSK